MIYFESCIYPVGLCISKSIEELQKYYTDADGNKLEKSDDAYATTYRMKRKGKHKGFAVGIVFWDKPVVNIIAHEAFHAADYIFNLIGADFCPDETNEHWAYLIGWIAGCCGDFVKKEFG